MHIVYIHSTVHLKYTLSCMAHMEFTLSYTCIWSPLSCVQHMWTIKSVAQFTVSLSMTIIIEVVTHTCTCTCILAGGVRGRENPSHALEGVVDRKSHAPSKRSNTPSPDTLQVRCAILKHTLKIDKATYNRSQGSHFSELPWVGLVMHDTLHSHQPSY